MHAMSHRYHTREIDVKPDKTNKHVMSFITSIRYSPCAVWGELHASASVAESRCQAAVAERRSDTGGSAIRKQNI